MSEETRLMISLAALLVALVGTLGYRFVVPP